MNSLRFLPYSWNSVDKRLRIVYYLPFWYFFISWSYCYYLVGLFSGPICLLLSRPCHLHAVHRCSLLLQMSHVTSWSLCVCVCLSVCLPACLRVCLSVCWAHGCAVQKWLNRSRFPFGGWIMCWKGCCSPTEGGTFNGDIWRPILTYLCVSELHIVCLLPWTNVPAQCARQRNAFAVTRGDRTAMRPFAELLSTLVQYIIPQGVILCTDLEFTMVFIHSFIFV